MDVVVLVPWIKNWWILMRDEKESLKRKAAEKGKSSNAIPSNKSVNDEIEKWKQEHPLPDDRVRDIFKRFLKK